MVDETAWWRWLRDLTHEKTQRGVARKVGVSHTTVQRWVRHGVPIPDALDLMIRFRGDPIEVAVLLGLIDDDDVAKLNYEALVKYVPAEVMSAELHRRVVGFRTRHPDVKLFKVSAIKM